MDFHTSDSDSRYLPDLPEEPSYPGSPNRMSQAAFVCGILSLVGIFFNASIFFGAFAILFALLSRRKRFSRQAKAAVRMAAVGISLAALAVIISIAVLISSGLLGKYAKRIANINPDDPAAVTKIENDLMKDLAKAYGVDPSSLQQSQNEENSPFDPTIENDHSADSAQSDADSSASESSGTQSKAGSSAPESSGTQSKAENSGTQSKAGNFRIQSKTPSGSDYI